MSNQPEQPAQVGSAPTQDTTGSAWALHRDKTADDCEAMAKIINDLAAQVRAGDMKAFERFWIEGGTHEGDAKVFSLRENLVLRYLCRDEDLSACPLKSP